MKTTAKDLMDCPFCGGKVEIVLRGNDFTNKRSAEIECSYCHTKQATAAKHNTIEWCEEVAIIRWNTRAYKSLSIPFQSSVEVTDKELLGLSKEEILQLYKNCYAMLQNYISLSGEKVIDIPTITTTDFEIKKTESIKSAEEILKDELSENIWTFICSYPVGHGENIMLKDWIIEAMQEYANQFSQKGMTDEDIKNAALDYIDYADDKDTLKTRYLTRSQYAKEAYMQGAKDCRDNNIYISTITKDDKMHKEKEVPLTAEEVLLEVFGCDDIEELKKYFSQVDISSKMILKAMQNFASQFQPKKIVLPSYETNV
jgi:hypothetical protein